MLTKEAFFKRAKIVKRYGNRRTGRRLARVAVDGWSCDVVTRLSWDDGDETRVGPIKEWGWEEYQKAVGIIITDHQLSRMTDEAMVGVDPGIIKLADSLVRQVRDECQQKCNDLRDVYKKMYQEAEQLEAEVKRLEAEVKRLEAAGKMLDTAKSVWGITVEEANQ